MLQLYAKLMQKSSALFLSLLVLSGMILPACGTPDAMVDPVVDRDLESSPEGESEDILPAEEEDSEESALYSDGTYVAEGSYQSPAGPESINVTLTVENDVITAVEVESLATNATSIDFQGKFVGGISTEIVGMNLDELEGVGNVAGSSLTPKGFNEALATIKAQAAS